MYKYYFMYIIMLSVTATQCVFLRFRPCVAVLHSASQRRLLRSCVLACRSLHPQLCTQPVAVGPRIVARNEDLLLLDELTMITQNAHRLSRPPPSHLACTRAMQRLHSRGALPGVWEVSSP